MVFAVARNSRSRILLTVVDLCALVVVVVGSSISFLGYFYFFLLRGRSGVATAISKTGSLFVVSSVKD